MAYASVIYKNVAAKHPDWSRNRVYTVTRNILSKNAEKLTAKNPEKLPDVNAQ